MAVLECRGLSKTYHKNPTPALSNIDLTLESGKIIGLLGPNGSGKTTLIKLASGLLTPTSGEIKVCGFIPGPESKAKVSYLPEKEYLPEGMSVAALLDYFNDFFADFDRPKALDMLGRLNITQTQKLKSMSKGTKEKVQLVLAMSRAAELYILDEPIGGVDPAARDYILETIIQNYSDNSTVLLSTHLISDIERVLDEYIFINNGVLAAHGSVEKTREEKGLSIDGLFREMFKN